MFLVPSPVLDEDTLTMEELFGEHYLPGHSPEPTLVVKVGYLPH